VATVTTAFGPEQGLRFINTFDLPWASPAGQTQATQTPPPARVAAPCPRRCTPAAWWWACAGGMCFAALDYYPTPAGRRPPRIRRRGRARRSTTICGHGSGIASAAWPASRALWLDAAPRRGRGPQPHQAREWPRLAARLVEWRASRAVLWCAPAASPTPPQNHQVVVWGYDRDDATGRVSLRLLRSQTIPRGCRRAAAAYRVHTRGRAAPWPPSRSSTCARPPASRCGAFFRARLPARHRRPAPGLRSGLLALPVAPDLSHALSPSTTAKDVGRARAVACRHGRLCRATDDAAITYPGSVRHASYRRIAEAEIERFARQVLEAAGVPPEHAGRRGP
jgi:hypothetical protein